MRWAGIEPVGTYDCIDLNLLESASQQPFQAGFGVDFYPTIYDKAACLFFSIAGGHIFTNGNKRTAVLALDQFCYANGLYLYLPNADMRRMAERTASYNERRDTEEQTRDHIRAMIAGSSFTFRQVKHYGQNKFYKHLLRIKNLIRRHPLNRPDARPRQAMLQQPYPPRQNP